MASSRKQDEFFCCLFCNDADSGHLISGSSASSSSSSSVAPSTLNRFIQFHHDRSNQINEEENPSYQSLFTNVTYCQTCLVKIYQIKSLFQQLDAVQDQLIQLQQEVLQQLKTTTKSLCSSRMIKQNQQVVQIISSELESSLVKSIKLKSTPTILIQFKDPASVYVKLRRLEDDDDDEGVQNQFYYNDTGRELDLDIKQEPSEAEEQVDGDTEDFFDPSEPDQDPEFQVPQDSDSDSKSNYERMESNEQEEFLQGSLKGGKNKKSPRITKNKKKERRYLCLYCQNLDPKDSSTFILPVNVWTHIKEKHEALWSTKQYDDDQEEGNSSLEDVDYCSTLDGAEAEAKMFSCTFCPRSYGSHKRYLNHLVGQHTNQVSILCLDDEDNEEETLDSEGVDNRSNELKCKFGGCEFKALSKVNLETHVKVIHVQQKELNPKQTNICTKCGLVFSSTSSLSEQQKHNKSHYNTSKEIIPTGIGGPKDTIPPSASKSCQYCSATFKSGSFSICPSKCLPTNKNIQEATPNNDKV